MPNIKLTYFDFPGRAETTRILLNVGGVKFEDCRIKSEDWPALKPKTPWGSLPFLEVNGKVLGQSKAVHRYAAKLTGLAGKTPMDAAMADSMVDGICDCFDGFVPVVFAADDQKEALKKEFLAKTATPFLERFEKMLKGNNGGNGYLVGSDMTWADVHFFVCFGMIKDNGDVKVLDRTPKLKALFERVETDAKVKKYTDSKNDST